METILNQITALLVEPSGSMVYHLVIAFVFISILQPALSFPANEKSNRQRLLLGVSLLVGSRLLLFGISLFAMFSASGLSTSLGVVEIAVNALDFSIVIWLFAFRKENHTGDIGLALFGLLIFAAGIISVIFWRLNGEAGSFNQSSLAFRWELATLVILIIGLVTLVRSETPAKIQGVTLLAILFIGEGLQLFLTPVSGDFFPISRLVHLMAFPLLSGVLQNYFTGTAETTAAQEEYKAKVTEFRKLSSLSTEEPLEDTLDMQTEVSLVDEGQDQPKTANHEIYQAGLSMATAEDSQEICDHFTRLTAHALLSDLCLLLSPPDARGQTTLISGYDLIVQEKVPGLSFNTKMIPGFDEMIESGEPLVLIDLQGGELDGLANLLYLDEIEHLLAFPIIDAEDQPVAVVTVLSPYSKHRWDEHDQSYLGNSIASINLLLQKAIAQQQIEVEAPDQSAELESAQEQIENLTQENQDLASQLESLTSQLDELSVQIAAAPAISIEEMETLTEEKSLLEATILELQEENKQIAEELEALQAQDKELAEQYTKLLEQQGTDEEAPISQDAQAHIDALSHANQKLAEHRAKALNQIDDLTLKVNEIQAINETVSQERDAYLKLNNELTGRINALKDQLSELTEQNEQLMDSLNKLKGEHAEIVATQQEVDPERVRMEQELEQAIQKAATFEEQLAEAATTLRNLTQFKANANGDNLEEQAEVIASIAQELRQPMSSINGYTDLLISESVGILGALQKKFLERVKASIDRMNHLIDDLIQVTTIDSGNFLFTLQPLELLDACDAAIDATSTQFREKELTLRVDISSNLPKLHTDKDALQQILLHLLNNAGTTTPNNGEVTLAAHIYEKSNKDVILFSVTDTGEGIPKEDLPRVFSRLYKADNPLIQGVGDTGVGLSIAKTLTEALGGRIWVDSELGKGSTFSVLLPTTSPAMSYQEG